MLNEKGFNLWANNYDKSVDLSCESNEYPFAGYREILNKIFNIIMKKPNSKILDIGVGTGVLAKRLYDNNHIITGIDFSDKMLKISRDKMKSARLIKHDFSDNLPQEIQNKTFNFIIFTYSIHHIADNKKAVLINSLKKNLASDGKIIIGDVSFRNYDDFTECQKQFSSIWDYDEFYYSYDNLKDKFNYLNKSYYQISICGGVMVLSD